MREALTLMLMAGLTGSAHAETDPGVVITCREIKGEIVRVVGRHETLRSKVLNEDRALLVSLPQGYATSTRRYPVLYLLDAEQEQLFRSSVAATDYLGSFRRMPAMIVVGILNTDRVRDLTPVAVEGRETSGQARRFLNFVTEELFAHVEGRYRTVPHRVLFGGSSAGAFAVYALFEEPDAFASVIASRPALGYADDYRWDVDAIFRIVEDRVEGKASFPRRLYLDHGTDEDSLHSPAALERLATLFETHAPDDLQWEIGVVEGGGHISAESLRDGLLKLFDGWWVSEASFGAEGLGRLEAHVQELSVRYGYPVGLEDLGSEADLNRLGYSLLDAGRNAEAAEVFGLQLSAYPESWDAYDSLAEAHMFDGDTARAIELYEKSLELNPDNENGRRMLQKLRQRN
jgi:predicted alpha/beta superfamily hydrolase